MKKLLAILLSVLMLCTMIPFATVFAAGEHYIELVADAEEVNAGDEVSVEVYMYGHESIGLIAAQIELGFDSDVFELTTYYDEDEEVWMPPIEVGPKFNASSNKYIMFPPIDEETGYMERCLVNFMRGTASATQAVKTNLFYTVTFTVKDDAPSGTYEIDVINYHPKNMPFYGNGNADWTWEPISIKVNGSEPEVPSCEHEYNYDCDTICSKCGEETRPEAEHTYFYACDQHCQLCGELTNPRAKHNVIHVEAVEATCSAQGNIEYWYCDVCITVWADEAQRIQTNMMSVKTYKEHELDDDCDTECSVCGTVIEPLHSREYGCSDVCAACGAIIEPAYPHNFEYACSTNCSECGTENPDAVDHNFVDGSCADCGALDGSVCIHEYFYFCDQYCMHCGELTNPDAIHALSYVPAVEATCAQTGNVEYWICEDCGSCWDNDEATGMPSNVRNFTTYADHVYDSDDDMDCNVCGEIREVDITINVLIHTGTSVSKDVNGLGFSFAVNVSNVIVENLNEFVSGTINPFDEGDCPLVRMGAIVSNVEGDLNLDSVDGKVVKDVKAKYLLDVDSTDGQIAFAVRIVNIPNVGKDVAISALPYFVYEMDGVEHVFYGDVVFDTYNNASNG